MPANVLTGLIPDIYAAIDVVSRELVGVIPATGRNSNGERAAVGENITVPITRANTATDIVPTMTPGAASDRTVDNVSIVINKSRRSSFNVFGEEQRGLNNGPGAQNIQVDEIAQAMRTLVNEVERDCAVEAFIAANRSFGTGGTTPFASDLSELASVRKILDDNGAPKADRHLIIDTTAGVNLRSLTQITDVDRSGDNSILRQGELTQNPLLGFAMRESAGVNLETAGTGTGYVVNLVAGYAVGDTEIAVDTGSGTILAGDTVTFAGDINQYVVASSVGGGTVTQVTIANPGLRQALADNTVMTLSRANSTFTPNIAFSRNSLQLVTRAPAKPDVGDLAIDSMMVTDDRSGLTFEISVYPGDHMARYDVALAWGVKAIKPEHIAQLLG